MSAPTLRDAVHVVNDRKTASGMVIGDPESATGKTRLVLSGLDLDGPELEALATAAAHVFLSNGAAMQVSPFDVVASTWIDGIAHGLTLARLRADHDTQEARRAQD